MTLRERGLKAKKVVTIAASDSSSSSDSDSDAGSGPSTSSSSRPSGPQAAPPPPPPTSSAHFYEHVLASQFPPRRGFAADSAWSAQDCRILAVIEAKYDALRYQQYQSDFFNATGRMVPAYLIRAKMDRDARPLPPSSAAARDAHDASSSSAGSSAASTVDSD